MQSPSVAEATRVSSPAAGSESTYVDIAAGPVAGGSAVSSYPRGGAAHYFGDLPAGARECIANERCTEAQARAILASYASGVHGCAAHALATRHNVSLHTVWRIVGKR